MDMQLPGPIAAYFEADRSRNVDAVAKCFNEDAAVNDERQVHAGREAIRRWKAEASSKFSYTVEPVAIGMEGDRTVVTGRVVGNFPGSPVDLRYFFVMRGEKIAELEIAP
ncbi:nuclear transport factor 2 family protein [Roseibium marinum]|uniref:SnoaL-like protein n=1 Tax=Roseibium marinum TaxID=281252 RepID=A0A2S3V3E0_9HYPH|nr:nuclear transport factor 2 family protein [Roseibium marinum]POF34471.1 SnoaL-like protein [Roseibium marinum]